MPCASAMSSGMSPQLPDSRGQAAAQGAGVSGTAGLAPWPQSNTKPHWTCSHYERKHQSHQARVQGNKSVVFGFSLFHFSSFVQKFLVVINVKSFHFSSCHCKCKLLQVHKPFFQQNHKPVSLGKQKRFFFFPFSTFTQQSKLSR